MTWTTHQALSEVRWRGNRFGIAIAAAPALLRGQRQPGACALAVLLNRCGQPAWALLVVKERGPMALIARMQAPPAR